MKRGWSTSIRNIWDLNKHFGDKNRTPVGQGYEYLITWRDLKAHPKKGWQTRRKKNTLYCMNYKKKILVHVIKMIDIGFITSIYSFLGIFLAKLCDKINGPFDKEKENKKPLWQIVVELVFYLWFIGIVIYVVRNVTSLIPFPLDGLYGFKHDKVKQLINATLFIITFMYFQKHYQDKIENLLLRL